MAEDAGNDRQSSHTAAEYVFASATNTAQNMPLSDEYALTGQKESGRI